MTETGFSLDGTNVISVWSRITRFRAKETLVGNLAQGSVVRTLELVSAEYESCFLPADRVRRLSAAAGAGRE